ncbi:MAG: toast rack family protein [Longimicrobiales bacterium]
MSERLRTALLAGVVATLLPGALVAQEWESLSMRRAFNGERALSVDVEYGAGTLTVGPGQPGTLYRAALRFDAEAFEPETSYENGRLHIGIDDAEVRGRHVEGGTLTLELSPRVPLDLDLAFGAAEANIELGGLHLRRLEIATGASATELSFSQPNPIQAESITFQVGAARFVATGLGNAHARMLSVEGGVGEVDLDFSGAWDADMDASIEMGLCKLTLRLPRGLGVHIEKDGLLAGIEAEGLIKQGNMYYTEGFQQAERKLTVEIDAAFNAIQIVWVGNLQANAR